jgi:hypothetical protein
MPSVSATRRVGASSTTTLKTSRCRLVIALIGLTEKLISWLAPFFNKDKSFVPFFL